ncbi:sugar transferase [Gammaproteobacteria bacterium]|jgi:lipopolysaccharide/colanic/teichoic acid biosynthesis glycosyltransferase|nr:sugar transferase [Gammaproteobacteria bacterium]
MQRLFDIIISGLAILVLSPMLLPIILLLRITGEGEVFFSQERIGKDGSLFSLHKFATMLKDSPNIGTGTLTVKNDPRILPLGNFLRKAKINELPQLFNVFKGDMSIVGPRPQSLRNFAAFSEDVQKNIMLVPPGLTGLGSIFFSGEEEMLTSAVNHDEFYDSVIMPYKGQLEIWYVRHANILIYLKIIYITAVKIIFPNLRLNLAKFFDGIPNPPKELQQFPVT